MAAEAVTVAVVMAAAVAINVMRAIIETLF